MSFLSRIFSRKSETDEPVRWSWPRIGILPLKVGTGEFSIAVASGSQFEKDIKAARKLHQSDSIPVYLNRETHNPDDPDAVVVMSALQERLGYLSREDAATYAPVLNRVAAAGLRAACTARTADRDRESIAMSLDIPDAATIEQTLKSYR